MKNVDKSSPAAQSIPKKAPGRRVRGVLVLVMGCLSIAAPFFATATLALLLVSFLLIACGVLEMLETFHSSDTVRRRSAYLSGILSVLVGILLLAQPQLVLRGLSLVVAGSFLIDGFSKTAAAWRSRTASGHWKQLITSGFINVALAFVLATRWPVSGLAGVVILVGFRMLSTGWSMLVCGKEIPMPVALSPGDACHPDYRLGLPPHEEFGRLQESLIMEEERRRRIDLAWCRTFIVVFFAIHIGRMHVEWNMVGMISPLVAVLGDVGTALLVAFGIILPSLLAWRWLTRPVERQSWKHLLARIDKRRRLGLVARLSRPWLVRRLRFSSRLAKMRYSPPTAMRWALQVGLPATAILIAVNPIWGFSWFFNSESWATEVWDRWAASRTDIWREQMVLAIKNHYQELNMPNDRLFQVAPEGTAGKVDFSFLVLGDTGEGGAAQHSLRDQFLFLGQRPDVKFLVISSDVIYPSGAMADYESKFYLPFKGFAKPIYAIPGNHDWYDALEGFAANFLEAGAARACMYARVATDNRLTTTTDTRIDQMIQEAERLRREFGVSTGWQRGPFFEIQADRFALIAVDTGVLRRVDTDQWSWLRSALERSKGKFTMAILGHPVYAGGRYQAGNDEPFAGEWVAQKSQVEVLGKRLTAEAAPFAAIHKLFREHQVEVVMAGDTHYFECYKESYEADGAIRTMYHIVNGGGGAYMSIGTPLDWPKDAPVSDCAYYPRKDFLIDKLDCETPAWKVPLWGWVKYFQAWPFTAESMAGAFLYSQAPYLQSFVEVRVENSKNQVRLIPHGAQGSLRWRELELFGAIMPAEKTGDDPVEFIIHMTPRRP